MTTRASLLAALVCAAALCGASASAQTAERNRQPSREEGPAVAAPAATAADPVANELGLLRRSLQTLNARLRELGDKFFGPDAAAKPGGRPEDRSKRIAQSLDLLRGAEQRAEVMRRQLLELTEKETGYRTRLVQLDEDLRPDSIDRAVSIVGSVGSARTPELRETRRRVLDNERRGVESLLNQTSQSRARLEEDVRQADALVARLRLRLLPLIEKEIDKIDPAQE